MLRERPRSFSCGDPVLLPLCRGGAGAVLGPCCSRGAGLGTTELSSPAAQSPAEAGHGGCASGDPQGEMGGYERWGKDNEGIKPTLVSSESLSAFPYP